MAQKYVNLYNTEAEYTADASNRPSTSSVSYAIDQNNMHYDGVNVITTRCPKIGDAVYGDTTTGKAVFYDGESLKTQDSGADAGTPVGTTGLQKIGVVVGRKGRKVLIHWWEDPIKSFAQVWQWVVAMTDGVYAGKVLTIKYWDPSSGTSGAMVVVGTYTVPSTVTTMADFASGLDTWLRANNPTGGGTAYNWHCDVGTDYLGNDAVLVTCDNNSQYQRHQVPISGTGVSCTLSMCNYLPEVSSFVRKDGSIGYDAVINADRFIISNSSSEHIKNRSGFDADTTLVNKYGSGDSGFRAYIEDMMARIPCATGGIAVTYGKSREWSKWMAGRTYIPFGGGEAQPQFTAASWCDTVGVSGVPQLAPGSFYMAGVDEVFYFLGRMKYSSIASERDIVDLTRAKMGSADSLLYVTRWLCARRLSQSAWLYDRAGFSYGTIYSPFNSPYRVSAVALFDLDA